MRYYSSTASEKTLSSAVSNTASSITLNNLTGLPASYPYTLVLDPDTASEEIVLVTGLSSGTTLNVTRGTDTYQGVTGGNGTAKQAHDAGAVVKHMITARDLQEPQDHIAGSQDVHGLSGTGSSGGDVVGTSKTQTLTNKTISSANNTLTVQSSDVSGLSTLLDAKANLAAPTFTGNVVLPSTTTIGSVDSTELGYLNGVTSAIQTQLDAKQASDSDLTALAGLSTTGIVVRTGAGTAATRTLVQGSGITITNADGVSGNITIAATGGGGSGTVTSVGMTVPTGLSVSGSPVTTSGTLAVSLASGYSIPTTTKQTNWDTAYDRSVGYYVSLYTGSALGPTADGVITYNSEHSDSNGFHSTSSNTSRITIPSNLGGKYKIDAFVNITAGTTTGDFIVYFTKNGTEITGTRGKAKINTTGDAQTISIAAIVPLVATDYVEVYLDLPGSSGSPVSVLSGFNANFVGA